MAMVQAAASDAVAANERKRLAKMIEDAGVTDDGSRWLDELTVDALAAMDELGQATATQLADAVPSLATRITLVARQALRVHHVARVPDPAGARRRGPPRARSPEGSLDRDAAPLDHPAAVARRSAPRADHRRRCRRPSWPGRGWRGSDRGRCRPQVVDGLEPRDDTSSPRPRRHGGGGPRRCRRSRPRR